MFLPDTGENVGILMDGDDYVMLHSPTNGSGIKRSGDLKTWTKREVIPLGQADWVWAQGRLTAGYVVNRKNDPRFGKYIMVLHANPVKGEGPISPATAASVSLGRMILRFGIGRGPNRPSREIVRSECGRKIKT